MPCQRPATATGCICDSRNVAGDAASINGSVRAAMPGTPQSPTSAMGPVDCGDRRGEKIADGQHKRPSKRMATARTATELRRWADLALIHRAFEARMPELDNARVGLTELAELCRRDYAARP